MSLDLRTCSVEAIETLTMRSSQSSLISKLTGEDGEQRTEITLFFPVRYLQMIEDVKKQLKFQGS